MSSSSEGKWEVWYAIREKGPTKPASRPPPSRATSRPLVASEGRQHWWERRLGEVEGGDGWVKSGRLK